MAKKPEQQPLPEMEQRDLPEIEQAAQKYREFRDERMRLNRLESEAKSALIQVMKNLGRTYYNFDGVTVQLEVTEGVKVRAARDDDEQVESRASVRESKEWVEDAKASVDSTTQGDTNEITEVEEADSADNVLNFFGKRDAAADFDQSEPSEIDDRPSPVNVTFEADDAPAVPDNLSKRDQALWYALNHQPGAANRWAVAANFKTLEDSRLTEAIRFEFGNKGGFTISGLKLAFAGGDIPKFWFGKTDPKGKPTLEGKALLAATRQLLNLPKPGKAGKVTASADDFTAEQCSICKRLDGAHDVNCPNHPKAKPLTGARRSKAQPAQKGGAV